MIPCTTAIAAKYWINTTGADCIFSSGWRSTVENISAPAGDTQTFDPRPRPATWVVALAVKPLGSLRSSLGFLTRQSCLASVIGQVYLLFQDRVRASDDLAIHKVGAKLGCTFAGLRLVLVEVGVEGMVIEVGRQLR